MTGLTISGIVMLVGIWAGIIWLSYKIAGGLHTNNLKIFINDKGAIEVWKRKP